MAPTKPSLELLRSLSDEHVLRALMAAAAGHAGGDRRVDGPLEADGLRERAAPRARPGAVVDTGERTTGRGRVGSYYALARRPGRALVASLAPEGIVAEAVDVYGDVVPARTHRRPAVADVARTPCARWPARRPVPARGRQRRRPGRPRRPAGSSSCPTRRSCVGALDRPRRARRRRRRARSRSTTTSTGRPAPSSAAHDFAYLHLGEGLGCAIVSDGEVRRGHAGLAGEIAHVSPSARTAPRCASPTSSPRSACAGPGRPRSTCDAAARGRPARRRRPGGRRRPVGARRARRSRRRSLLGGPWGPALLDPISEAFSLGPRHTPIEPATVRTEPSLTAARTTALQQLRDAVIARR